MPIVWLITLQKVRDKSSGEDWNEAPAYLRRQSQPDQSVYIQKSVFNKALNSLYSAVIRVSSEHSESTSLQEAFKKLLRRRIATQSLRHC